MKRPTRKALLGLYRSHNGLFLGVCAGIAERFRFSPWGVRLLFLVTQIFFWKWTFLVYLALALLLRPDPVSRLERRLSRFDI
jgi:phage shock protein PspC (stress-responsive transcriptional regulator)